MSRLVNEKILARVPGVIHVGANVGQERDWYAKYDLNVLWFEPNPVAFGELLENIESFPKQRASSYLLTNVDNKFYKLHVTSGQGQCSSIFALSGHLDYYPDITFTHDVDVLGITLDTFVGFYRIDLSKYQFMVLDTQMADLLVLKGATQTLSCIQFVEVETSPLDLYKGGCVEQEIIDFMASQNYKEVERVVNTHINNHLLFERQA